MPTLREGSIGVYVQILQTALKRAGFDIGETDGEFGPITKRGVIDYQKANSLVPDGIVGVLTWGALKPFLTGYAAHTISQGETFWQLARVYGTTVSRIRTANPDADPLNLRIGSVITIPLDFEIVPTDISYTYSLVTYIVEGLVKRFPFIGYESAGRSVLGRELHVLKIGTGKKEVFYNATHHANEWITTVLLLKFIEDIASAYADNGRMYGNNLRDLFGNVTLYIMPLVNPDGMDIVTGGIMSDTLPYKSAVQIAERYPSVSFPAGWKANIAGTDLNLNYPAGWEIARAIKFGQGIRTPAPRDYVGTAPLSAPESSAVYEYTLAHNFVLAIAYHTQGEEIYWRFSDYQPDGALEIGREFERLSGYRLRLPPPQSSYAGYKDWFIQEYDRPGYTVEAGRGTNPLPISQFDKIYRDNFGILIYGAAQTVV